MGQTSRATPPGAGNEGGQPNESVTFQTTRGRTEAGTEPAPTKLPVVDTIAAVEEGARQLSEEDAEDLRGRVCGILRHAKPLKDNLTKEQRKALKELRSLEDEVILPADKGNTTVMITREEYDRKMRGMLNTATYKRLKKDPTATQEGKLS